MNALPRQQKKGTSMRCSTGWIAVSAAAGFVALLGPASCSCAPAQTKSILFGKLVDGTGKVRSNALVVVKGGRIRSVGLRDGSTRPDGELIDLSGYTGIPGLIDVHTHMTYYWDGAAGTRPWEQLATRAPAASVLLAQENARKTVQAGVTTVRDLGAGNFTDIAMRDLINAGAMTGPRMFVAGHGLHIRNERARPAAGTRASGQARGVSEVMRAVRAQIAAGADVVKMFGSTGSGQDVSGDQTFTYEEMKAAVDAAHNLGRRIAIHSYGPKGARDAVKAGADSIEHATDLDDDTLAEMARRKIFYVPTIDHNRYYAENRAQFGYGPEAVKGLEDYLTRNLETARRAHRAGVLIAMGSDAVFTMFGQNTRELRWFVRAGMTPAQALASATVHGAALLGMEKSLGAIAPGYRADVIAVEGDPIADVNVVIDHVRWVMKGGVVVVDKITPNKATEHAAGLAVVSPVAGQGPRDQGFGPAGKLVLFDGTSLNGWKKTFSSYAGEIKVEGGSIVMSAGRPMTGITSTRADLPRTDYELSYEAKRTSGSDFFAAATFPVGDSFLTFVNGGWGGSVTGLSSINGVDASENETTQSVRYKEKTWYSFRVRVTSQVIRCSIDGKEIVAINHDGRKLSTRIEVRGNQPLGFATYETTGAVRKIEIRALSPAEVAAANKLDG
jgi:imidazolonepropionase-like amidohydrolase